MSKQIAVRNPGVLAAPSRQPVGKKPVKKALEEDEFTEALTNIIRRDFFPDIPKLEAQLEFIEASQSNDHEKLREISERFSATTDTRTPAPAATPATFETPVTDSAGATPLVRSRLKHSRVCHADNASADDPPPDSKKQKLEEGKGLDKFLSQYQSEDDASFGELMEKAREERRQKHAWLYEKEKEYNSEIAVEGPEERLAITDGREKGGTRMFERGSSVKTWGYTNKNSLMYIPEGVELSAKERVENASEGREVVHTNTRLSREFLRKTQASLLKAVGGAEGSGKGQSANDKIGIDGKTFGPAESPQVNGYGFVATPQIHPGVDASPLMTWGTIEGTPFRLETDVIPTTGPSFKMPKISRREQVAMKLAEKAAKANKERKKAAMLAASPALLRQKLGATPTASERLQLLSPAAQKLVSRTTTPGSIHGADRALRASYTPKHTPLSAASPQSTPQRSSSGTTPRHKASGGSTPSLTDNLLNLRKR